MNKVPREVWEGAAPGSAGRRDGGGHTGVPGIEVH